MGNFYSDKSNENGNYVLCTLSDNKLDTFLTVRMQDCRSSIYDRNHADEANMMAQALEAFVGIVIWLCFVYNCIEKSGFGEITERYTFTINL